MSDVTAESMLDAVAPRTLGVEVPDEPPRRSVVLDADGWAWQRLFGGWVRVGTVITFLSAGRAGNTLAWPHLLADHGRVELIYRAPAPDNTGESGGAA